MHLVSSTITLVLIFTTIYSYGLFILKLIYKNEKFDIFFSILSGYILIGSITLIYHFFFQISNNYSLFIIFFGLILFILNRKTLLEKEFFKIVFLILIFSFLLYAYSEHPIDTNMYHHPYVSYLNSEKIIFAIANIQFRFGHVSFLQYVQAALKNNFLHEISLASINIIFYSCFVYLFSKEINKSKTTNLILIIKILFLSFILIKFARYREYGNDLIPLLVSIYFLTKIINSKNDKVFNVEKLINLALPFAAFMFLHKISYIFVFAIFFSLIHFSNLKILKNINFISIVFFLVLLIPWLIKNYIVTSCLAYPVEISCFSNSLYELKGIASPANAAWLTEIWAKGFIDHPNWREINLQEYANGINWIPTWLSGHFIKILEIISPLLFIILLVIFYLFYKKKSFLIKKNKKNISTIIFYLWIANLVGLFMWFYNAPIFRYGSFYIISFIILTFVLILSHYFILKKTKNIKFFKTIFAISLIFFVLKNFQRMINTENSFFAKTSKEMNELSIYKNDDLKLLRPKSDICYYTESICSHEIPNNIRLIKIRNYNIYMQ